MKSYHLWGFTQLSVTRKKSMPTGRPLKKRLKQRLIRQRLISAGSNSDLVVKLSQQCGQCFSEVARMMVLYSAEILMILHDFMGCMQWPRK